MPISYNIKKPLSLLSGLFIHSEFGAMYTLGTITPYIASYLKYHGQPGIHVADVAVNYPIMMVSLTTGMILCMYLCMIIQAILPECRIAQSSMFVRDCRICRRGLPGIFHDFAVSF